MMERKKILVLSDHPLVPSGVGIQTKYVIEGLLRTGKYKFYCLGGAIKHADYRIQHVAPDQFGDGNWIIKPVDGHGDKNVMRATLQAERPDAVWIITDPRFFVWLWEMEDEIRSICPLLYWHVWDNDPSPDFNHVFYESTDWIGCISRKTSGILQDLGYERHSYIPHALPDELFKPLPNDVVADFKRKHYGPHADKDFVVMWNNRNARRKQTGDVVACFAKFMRKVGADKTCLFMHTQPGDPEGQDVLAVAKKFGCDANLVISENRIQPEVLNHFYNVADVTINIASNEGFGLSTLESLFSGTPILVHMTGGLQFQIGDWWDGLKRFNDQDALDEIARKRYPQGARWFGVPIFTASRSCTGSQQIPYIYDDRVNHDDVVKGLVRLYEMGRKKRKELGTQGREWARAQFNMDNMVSSWDDAFTNTIDGFTPVGMRTADI